MTPLMKGWGMTRFVRILGAVLFVLVGGTGCSSSTTSQKSPTDVLAAAKETLDSTSGVRIALSTEQLPKGVSGIVSAEGVGTHAPAFEGNLKVSATGVTADVPVVAVDRKVYAKLPFTTTFEVIEPALYSAPDPAVLMGKERGLSSLLTGATGVTEGDPVRQGDMVLTDYSGTVPGTVVAGVIPSASPKASFDATFSVSADSELRKAVIAGPFYPQAEDVTYTITFDDYGSTPDIAVP